MGAVDMVGGTVGGTDGCSAAGDVAVAPPPHASASAARPSARAYTAQTRRAALSAGAAALPRLRCPARLRPARASAAPPRAWSSF
jgi:hypothetical protein